jgi:hypothetical protein
MSESSFLSFDWVHWKLKRGGASPTWSVLKKWGPLVTGETKKGWRLCNQKTASKESEEFHFLFLEDLKVRNAPSCAEVGNSQRQWASPRRSLLLATWSWINGAEMPTCHLQIPASFLPP